ncbi:MAG: hypothetical protein R3276_12305, partial [Marinobacter sp.]|nr:hypothetical protein [Marinobacter sp.]
VSGIAIGGIYALIALGFVAVYKVSGTFNFSQGGFVLLGAFVTYQYNDDWGLPFFLALLLAMITLALVAMAAERLVIRPMIGKPPFAVLLITIGLLVMSFGFAGRSRVITRPEGLLLLLVYVGYASYLVSTVIR